MPHLTLEYSANLAGFHDMSELCGRLAECLASVREDDKPVYPVGGIRVRAIRCESYSIADGESATDAFLHAALKIGAGRSEAVKRRTGDALFGVIKAHFSEHFSKDGLALSLEISEFSESGTWKHNNLHARLKAKQAQE